MLLCCFKRHKRSSILRRRRAFLCHAFDDVLGEFAPDFVVDVTVEDLHATRGNVHRVKPNYVALADLDLKAKPVGAVETARGIEGDRYGESALEVLSGGGDDASADALGPGSPAD